MQTIALEVTDSVHGILLRRSFPLPVSIGRGSNADIQLTAENRAISRIHLEIVDERGKIVVYNRASNVEATVFKGRPLAPNERLELEPGDVLKIFETTITLLPSPQIGILFAQSADLKIIASEPLVQGSGLLANERDGTLVIDVVADITKIGPDRLGTGLATLFYYDGAEPTFAILANPSGHQVLLDKEIVAQPALYVHPEDTIEAGAYRFEIVAPGTANIVCENADCRVLNSCDRAEGCRRCGSLLYGSTRLLRVRKL